MNNQRSDELAILMQEQLTFVKNAEAVDSSSICKASECLNKAAELFDEAGLSKEAAAITKVLQGVLKG